MKLEYRDSDKNKIIDSELGLSQYLEIFDVDIPVLPHKILNPLSRKELSSFFESLEKIKNQTKNIDELIQKTKDLPNIAYVFPMIEQKNLSQSGLFSLNQFIQKNQLVLKIEPLAHSKEIKSGDSIIAKLKKWLDPHSGQIITNSKIKNLENQLERLEKQLNTRSSQYEADIFKACHIKMIYPFPKEIPCDHPEIEKITQSPLLKPRKIGSNYHIDYILPEDLVTINTEKKKIEDEHFKAFQIILNQVASIIYREHKKLLFLYDQRIKRTYQYILLYCMKKHHLIIPTISDEISFELEEGILPAMMNNRKKHYRPLSLKLKKGSNILFGANMAGKTSVLKTIYFLSFMVNLGLPIPAKNLIIHAPSEVKLHLKSSGSIINNLSSFGEELDFFSNDFAPYSIILVDELFQTTNPIAGKELSEIFLKFFSKKNLIFFCTTQYPDILKIKNINLYKMKDIKEEGFTNIHTINDLIDQMPFTVEGIDASKTDLKREGRMALMIARHFMNNKIIKNNIGKKIKG